MSAGTNIAPFLSSREHLDALLEVARLRMLSFLFAARRLGWLTEGHCDERWFWPSFAAARAALLGGPERAGLPLDSALEEESRVREAERALLEALSPRVAAAVAAGASLPLVTLSRTFRLSAQESELLVFGLAAELDPAFRAGLQLWRRDAEAQALDVDTALLLVGEGHEPARTSARGAFEPRAPLIDARLFELGARPEGKRTLFRVADSVVRFALGGVTVGGDVQQIARFVPVPVDPLGGGPAPSSVSEAFELLSEVSTRDPAHRPIAAHILGPDGSARRSIVEAAVARSGRPLLSLHLGLLVACGNGVNDMLRRIRRDAMLTGAIVHVHLPDRVGPLRAEDTASPDPAPPIHRFEHEAGGDEDDRTSETPTRSQDEYALLALQHHLATAPPIVVVTGPVGTVLFAGTRELVGRATSRLDSVDATHVLTATLGGVSAKPILREVAESFSLTAGDLVIASRTALLESQVRRTGERADERLLSAVVSACQARVHSNLTSFSQRVRSRATWSDVVLSDAVLVRVRELAAYAANYQAIFYDWGFDASMPSGRALTALFSGPSGTGKTLVAQVIANELRRPLYRIDLSRVMSKYIGETERQLARVFDEAQREGALLLFDEADSIFSKRTEVQTSNDRYSNASVNFLLQRLDTFEGMAILTTNKKDAMDSALRRRIKFHVDFELPDAHERELLWETHIPRHAPIDGSLDLAWLAKSAELSGANIRNAVLRACLAAIADGRGLSQELLVLAAERECAELGKLVRRA